MVGQKYGFRMVNCTLFRFVNSISIFIQCNWKLLYVPFSHAYPNNFTSKMSFQMIWPSETCVTGGAIESFFMLGFAQHAYSDDLSV